MKEIQIREVKGASNSKLIEDLYSMLIKNIYEDFIEEDFEDCEQSEGVKKGKNQNKYLNLYFSNSYIKKTLIQDLEFISKLNVSKEELKRFLLLQSLFHFDDSKLIIKTSRNNTNDLKHRSQFQALVEIFKEKITAEENEATLEGYKALCLNEYLYTHNLGRLQTIIKEDRKNFLLFNLSEDQILTKEYFTDVYSVLRLISGNSIWKNESLENQLEILEKLFNDKILRFKSWEDSDKYTSDYYKFYLINLYYQNLAQSPDLLPYLVTRQLKDLLLEALNETNFIEVEEVFVLRFIFQFLPKIIYLNLNNQNVKGKILDFLQCSNDLNQNYKLILELLSKFGDKPFAKFDTRNNHILQNFNKKIATNQITSGEVKEAKILLIETLGFTSINQLNMMIQAIISQAKELQKMRSEVVDISTIKPDETPNCSMQQIKHSIRKI